MGIALAVVMTCVCGAQPSTDFMVRLTLQHQAIEGMPVAWNRSEVHLLGRDGRLWAFPPGDASDFQQTSDRFQGYSISDLRALLLREFGQDFEVSGTDHFLVVHPRGEGDRWAQRFEDLYRSFFRYFSLRGLRPSQPPFPLIGVVCKDRNQFLQHSGEHAQRGPAGVVGCYNLESNRVFIYDFGGGEQSAAWQKNASVLIHEATHQTAFNTGIHSRYTPPPLWVAEGLATLFEAPGVYGARNYGDSADQMNQGRFRDFKARMARHRPELLVSLIASDDLFRADPMTAYAEAWAMTYYLVETQPQKYAAYLSATARRAPFVEVTAKERLADFAAIFGSDWRMLEAQLLRYMADRR